MTAILVAVQKTISIWYPVQFQLQSIDALIDFDSKVNIMIKGFTDKQDLISGSLNVSTQKIDSTYLKIYIMVTVGFLLQNSQKGLDFWRKSSYGPTPAYIYNPKRFSYFLGIQIEN